MAATPKPVRKEIKKSKEKRRNTEKEIVNSKYDSWNNSVVKLNNKSKKESIKKGHKITAFNAIRKKNPMHGMPKITKK
jgi:hypothetical protein